MAYRNVPHFVPSVSVTQLQERIEREINTNKWESLNEAVILENRQRQKGHMDPGTSTRSLTFQYMTLTTTLLCL